MSHVVRFEPFGALTRQSSNADEDRERARRYFYSRLMQVVIYHEYYNTDDERCPDFEVLPTDTTQALLDRIGLLFRSEPFGFSVLFDRKREDELVSWVRRPSLDQEGPSWKRLSFQLISRNHKLLNFTRLPLDFNPLQKNLYFSNYRPEAPPPTGESDWEMRDGGPISTRKFVSRRDAVSVVPAKFATKFFFGAEEIKVKGISNMVLQCYPRCFNPKVLKCKDLDEVRCKDALPPDEGGKCRETLYVNLSTLPMDKYTLSYEDGAGRSTSKDFEVLYSTGRQTPIAFVDLLFTRPRQNAPGVYPIVDADPPIPSGVRYELRFRSRETIWRYFVVPRGRELREYKRFRIVCERAPWSPQRGANPCAKLRFGKPTTVEVANGQAAKRFDANTPIRLRQRYDFVLSLKATERETDRTVTLVARLPTPTTDLVGAPESSPRGPLLRGRRFAEDPGPAQPRRRPANTSDVYVYF